MYRYKKLRLPAGRLIDEHRLVIERKLGRRLRRSEHVHHVDGHPRNNDPSNLEIVSPWKHVRHHRAGKRGRKLTEAERKRISFEKQGSKNPSAKLSEEQVAAIRSQLTAGKSPAEIAKIFPVSRMQIHRIARGECWKNEKWQKSGNGILHGQGVNEG